jgi:hypothetical protein
LNKIFENFTYRVFFLKIKKFFDLKFFYRLKNFSNIFIKLKFFIRIFDSRFISGLRKKLKKNKILKKKYLKKKLYFKLMPFSHDEDDEQNNFESMRNYINIAKKYYKIINKLNKNNKIKK